MTMLFTHTQARGKVTFERSETSLLIDADGIRIAQLAGLPPHVAEHTAAAFNRAMQAVPTKGTQEGWTYTGKSGVWHITHPMPRLYTAQSDEITGDGDPYWMFAEASSLIDVMDVIDAIEAEESCDVCHHLVGSGNLTEHDDSLYCDDCAKTESERERGLAEMAADDAVHAHMDRVAGL